MSTEPPRPRTAPTAVVLTDRERVVLACLERETTLREIAADLFVTRNTVKSQVRSVYRKLGASSRADALTRAQEHGLR